MTIVASGPVQHVLPYCNPDKFDVSFRILTSYDVSTDNFVCRIDIRKDDKQMNVGFYTGLPSVRGVGSFGPRGDLVMPNGPYEGFSVRAHSSDIILALRGMADALEGQIKMDAEGKNL